MPAPRFTHHALRHFFSDQLKRNGLEDYYWNILRGDIPKGNLKTYVHPTQQDIPPTIPTAPAAHLGLTCRPRSQCDGSGTEKPGTPGSPLTGSPLIAEHKQAFGTTSQDVAGYLVCNKRLRQAIESRWSLLQIRALQPHRFPGLDSLRDQQHRDMSEAEMAKSVIESTNPATGTRELHATTAPRFPGTDSQGL